MSRPYFQFKQFTVWHDLCSMKVGTDGTLLGAWVTVHPNDHVLDVGTGSGLIALMVAQRGAATVCAIDVDEGAVQQASFNVRQSPWASRIVVQHADFTSFVAPQPYQLVVCNPPFFSHALKGPDAQRNLARHTSCLCAHTLMEGACRMLDATGRVAIVVPFDQAALYVGESLAQGLALWRRCDVVTMVGKPPKRTLLEFARERDSGQGTQADTLCLETVPGVPSAEYQALLHDFYLRF